MSLLGNLFGTSPIRPMQKHMEAAVACAREVGPLVEQMAAGNVDAFLLEVLELIAPERVVGHAPAECDPGAEAGQSDRGVRGWTSPLTNHPIDPDLHISRHGEGRPQQEVGSHERVTQDARSFRFRGRDGEGGGAWVQRISGA